MKLIFGFKKSPPTLAMPFHPMCPTYCIFYIADDFFDHHVCKFPYSVVKSPVQEIDFVSLYTFYTERIHVYFFGI